VEVDEAGGEACVAAAPGRWLHYRIPRSHFDITIRPAARFVQRTLPC